MYTFLSLSNLESNNLYYWRVRSVSEGVKSNWSKVFQFYFKDPKMVEFEYDFYSLIERVQSMSDEIDEDVNMRVAYGITRSLRWGVNAHAMNMKVDNSLL